MGLISSNELPSNSVVRPAYFFVLALSVSAGAVFYLPGVEQLLFKYVGGGLFVLLALVIWAAGGLVNRDLSIRYPVDWRLPAAFWLLVMASGLFSVDRSTSLTGVYAHYQGVPAITLLLAAYFLSTQIDWSERRLLTFLGLLGAGALVNAAFAWLQAAAVFGWHLVETGPRDLRTIGLMGNANALGSYISPIIPLAVFLAIMLTGAKRALAASAVLLMIVAALSTLSIAAWLSLIVMSLALGVDWLWRQRRLSGGFLAVVLVIALIIGGFFALSYLHLLGPVSIFDRIMRLDVTDPASSVGHRIQLWKATAKLIPRRPLVGWGPDTFKLVSPLYGDLEVARNLSPHPHNLVLGLAVNLGIMAALIFLAIAGRVLWRAWTRPKEIEVGLPWERDPRLWIGVAVTGQLVVSLTQSLNFQPFLLFWLLAGVMSTLNQKPTKTYNIPRGGQLAVTVLLMALLLAGGSVGFRAVGAEIDYRRSLRAGSVKQAVALVKRAKTQNPYFPVYLYRYARTVAGGKNDPRGYRRALAALRAAQQRQPLDPTLYLIEARLHEKSGAPGGLNLALAAAIRALKVYPRSFAAHMIAGDVSYAQGDYRTAAGHYEETAKIKGRSFYVWYRLGKSRQRSGDKAGALAAYEESLKYKPGAPGALAEIESLKK